MKTRRLMNDQVRRFREIDSQLKSLESEREKLREGFLKEGDFETPDFTVLISESSQERIAGMAEFRKTGLEDLIRNKGLVKAVSFRRVVVKVKVA